MAAALRILVAPLDWGLGHATRCIPLIRKYLAEGNEVILAGYGRSGSLLQKTFPDLTYVELPGFVVRYPKGKNFLLKMAIQLPRLWLAVRKEHRALDRLIARYQPDFILSDNRYGLYSKKVKTAILTHQLFIRAGIWSKPVNTINQFYLQKFDQCLVPDYETDPTLSGALSHGKKLPFAVSYLGPLSRFEKACEKKSGFRFRYTVLLSGPEPQRSLLEKKLAAALQHTNAPFAIVQGKPDREAENEQGENRFAHLDTEQLYALINDSEMLICRPGYSTLMDLEILGKKALFIPTPGQTEQEYLAHYHAGKYPWIAQHEIENTDFSMY